MLFLNQQKRENSHRNFITKSQQKNVLDMVLKVEQCGFTIELCRDTDRMANSVNSDQTAPLCQGQGLNP